ncbi:hypothetical protein BDB01DRAFT_830579 [Pilobolus umbonatus]|nr:hypothetical protein BDB01DRAFT_830579 [Pilobolus umbonatus]
MIDPNILTSEIFILLKYLLCFFFVNICHSRQRKEKVLRLFHRHRGPDLMNEYEKYGSDGDPVAEREDKIASASANVFKRAHFHKIKQRTSTYVCIVDEHLSTLCHRYKRTDATSARVHQVLDVYPAILDGNATAWLL